LNGLTGDWTWLIKALDLGLSALLILLIYRLTDKWAGRFLEAQTKQAEAMGDLAAAVRSSIGDQREILLAVRVLATKQDETRMWIQELAQGAAQGKLFGGATS